MLKAMFQVASLLVLLTGAAQAAVVQNGSFEQSFPDPGKRNGGQVFDLLQSGPGSSWQIWDNLPGWTAQSGAGIEVQSNRTLRSIDAQDGSHYVELDSSNNSSMFQNVLLGAGDYVLSFFYSPRTSRQGSNGIAWSMGTLVSGTVDETQAGTAVGQWTQISRIFNVAASGTYALSFSAVGRSDSLGGLLDNISILAAPAGGTSPVPVPGAALLLITAAGTLAALRGAKPGQG